MTRAQVDLDTISFANDKPFVLMGGMNVLESRELALRVAEHYVEVCARLAIPYVFKASFDKANRSSIDSFRGPGLEQGLRIFSDIKQQFSVPIITDVHEPEQAASGPLRIRLRRGRFRLGETVAATAEWRLHAAPKYLELRLFWYTSGIGDEDVSVVAQERIDPAGASGERPFRLKLPETPRSYSGRSFSIHWALELVAQPGEETARAEFEVV